MSKRLVANVLYCKAWGHRTLEQMSIWGDDSQCHRRFGEHSDGGIAGQSIGDLMRNEILKDGRLGFDLHGSVLP